MKKIQLTGRGDNGKNLVIVGEAIVDDEDYEKVKKYRWNIKKNHCNICAVHGKAGYLHHFVFGKPPVGFETDHIDNNVLNNQKNNLRFVTQRENSQNRRSFSKSGFKGITKYKNRYNAVLKIDGKLIQYGGGNDAEYLYLRHILVNYYKRYNRIPKSEKKISEKKCDICKKQYKDMGAGSIDIDYGFIDNFIIKEYSAKPKYICKTCLLRIGGYIQSLFVD